VTVAARNPPGPFEIQSPLGAGGMREVCRARDSKLNRDGTVKVLPESLEWPSLPNGLASASSPVTLV
jgi:serine/threonine protein kinase